MKKVSQAVISIHSCIELSKTQFFPVSINLFNLLPISLRILWRKKLLKKEFNIKKSQTRIELRKVGYFCPDIECDFGGTFGGTVSKSCRST